MWDEKLSDLRTKIAKNWDPKRTDDQQSFKSKLSLTRVLILVPDPSASDETGDEEKVKEQLRKVNRGDMPPHLFIYFFSALFIWVSKNQNYGNPSSQSEQKSTSSLANEDSMQKQANYQKRGETSSHDWFSRLV